jgi:hypothetical protein
VRWRAVDALEGGPAKWFERRESCAARGVKCSHERRSFSAIARDSQPVRVAAPRIVARLPDAPDWPADRSDGCDGSWPANDASGSAA